MYNTINSDYWYDQVGEQYIVYCCLYPIATVDTEQQALNIVRTKYLTEDFEE